MSVLDTAKRYFECYNAYDWNAIADVLGDDIEVTHYNRGFQSSGKEGMLGLYAATDGAIADRKFTNQSFFTADGDRVISQATFVGKNLVDTAFGEAGTEYSVDLCTILTIRDGKVVKYEDYG